MLLTLEKKKKNKTCIHKQTMRRYYITALKSGDTFTDTCLLLHSRHGKRSVAQRRDCMNDVSCKSQTLLPRCSSRYLKRCWKPEPAFRACQSIVTFWIPINLPADATKRHDRRDRVTSPPPLLPCLPHVLAHTRQTPPSKVRDKENREFQDETEE